MAVARSDEGGSNVTPTASTTGNAGATGAPRRRIVRKIVPAGTAAGAGAGTTDTPAAPATPAPRPLLMPTPRRPLPL